MKKFLKILGLITIIIIILIIVFYWYVAKKQRDEYSFDPGTELINYEYEYKNEGELSLIKIAENVNCPGQLYCLNSEYLGDKKAKAEEKNNRPISIFDGMVDVTRINYKVNVTDTWPLIDSINTWSTNDFYKSISPNSKYYYVDGTIADYEGCLEKAGDNILVVHQYFDYFSGVPKAFSSSSYFSVDIYTLFDINNIPACRAVIADDQTLS